MRGLFGSPYRCPALGGVLTPNPVTCGTCSALSSQTTSSTSGTGSMSSYGMQWPGSEASLAPPTTSMPRSSHCQSRWAARHPILQDGRTPRLLCRIRGSGRHSSPHPHTRIPPGQHPTYHPTPTLPGDLCREQGGSAGLANRRAGQGCHRGVLQAGQSLAHHDTLPALTPPHRL
jgi:hypothetical protein